LNDVAFSATLLEFEAEFDAFLAELKEFRRTLNEEQKRLLDAMYYAALGKYDRRDDEVSPYWEGARALARDDWTSSPWGVAFRTYYPNVTFRG